MCKRYLLLAIVMVLIHGCAGSAAETGLPLAGTARFEPAQFADLIPSPAQASRQLAATGGQHCDGADYDHGFSSRVAENGAAAEFTPDWRPAEGFYGLAYALYRCDIAAGNAQADLELHWQAAPEYWIGVANAARLRWDWFSAPPGGSLPLSLADYRFAGTQVQVVVVALGTAAQVLHGVDLETGAAPGPLRKLFFLHHSTGWGIISEGNIRGYVSDFNAINSETFEFWDQGYNGDGVRDQAENYYDTQYFVPNDNTDPDGLHYLWTSTEADAVACRNGLLADYEVIAFKSCFPASAIYDDARLEQYKTWYREIRDVLDTHPERLFVVMSTPPLVPGATDAAQAQRAREFSNWLASPGYLAGHPNIACFNLFDALAAPIASGPEANMLRAEYRGLDPGDSHPNTLANATVGPLLAQFMLDAAMAYAP